MVPHVMVAGATFFSFEGKKMCFFFTKAKKKKKKHWGTFSELSQKSMAIIHLLCHGRLTNKHRSARWDRWKWMGVKDSSRLQGWSVFINSVPHILFRGATALLWCSLLMPHSCNQEQDSNTCCFHHGQLFGCRRVAPLARKQRWTRRRNSPRGLFLWWLPPWKHRTICLSRRPRGARLIITMALWWCCGVGIKRQQALSSPLFQLNGTEASPIDSDPFIIFSPGCSDCQCTWEGGRKREKINEREDVWNRTGRKTRETAKWTATKASSPRNLHLDKTDEEGERLGEKRHLPSANAQELWLKFKRKKKRFQNANTWFLCNCSETNLKVMQARCILEN